MEHTKIAANALCSNVELHSCLAIGSARLQTYRTVGVWPEDRISILDFGDSYVVCRDESSVAECVAALAPNAGIEPLLSFIRQALPSYCFVLDDEIPQSIVSEIKAEWSSPSCTNNVLSLFINDGKVEGVFKWVIDELGFHREFVGRGVEVIRA